MMSMLPGNLTEARTTSLRPLPGGLQPVAPDSTRWI
jgi:hypothetical protein